MSRDPSPAENVASRADGLPEPGPALAAPTGAAPSQKRFEALFMPLATRAFRLAMTLTRRRSEAEDLLQEAALAAFRGFASFTVGTNFKAWFYRILVNCHYAKYRRERSRPETLALDDTPELYLYARTAELGLHGGDGDPAALLMRKMTSGQVRHAIADLPAEFGAAVSLFFLEEMSYDDIAAVLDCPVGTVRSRLHRGRRMMQKRLWQIAREAGLVSQPENEEARP